MDVFPLSIGKDLALQGRRVQFELGEIRFVHGNMAFFTGFPDDLHRLRASVIAYHGTARLDDTSFVSGDFRYRITKIFRVLQTDICDNGNLRGINSIRAVHESAQTNFQNYNVTVLLKKILHGNGGDEFKLAGMILHGICFYTNLFGNIR